MFVTDTLGNPYIEMETLGSWYGTIAESRRQANEIKLEEPIVVVIGNPPYKEKAKGRGGWIEQGTSAKGQAAPLAPLMPPSARGPSAGGRAPPPAGWMPPSEGGAGAHAKHLRNLYVYFWRWATWKVFGGDPYRGGTEKTELNDWTHRRGVVSFIS